jgi:hypothetical protein
MVENDGAHADQCARSNVCTMNDRKMADGSAIFNLGVALFECAMDHCAVLDVHPFADSDGSHITAQYGSEPNRALLTEFYISHEGAIGRQPTTGVPAGRNAMYR